LAWKLGAAAVIPEGPNATPSIQAVRHFFGGGVDTAMHVAGDPAVVAGMVRAGGKFTTVTDTDTDTWAVSSAAEFVPTVVAPSGPKLADLLLKVAAQRLRSHVHRSLSFDQVRDALQPASTDTDGRIVRVR
jgi:hypothetical protein